MTNSDTRPDPVTDANILAALARTMFSGGRVHTISDRMGLGGSARPKITRRLLAMERKGIVRRSERYSVPNSYYWEIVPAPQTEEQASA